MVGNNMKNKVKVLALSSALIASGAYADIAFNGFASIVAGQTTSSEDSLYGYNNDIDFNQGSLFALQASSDLGSGLSVTAQIIARGENDWDPDFEWAYVSYEANDNLRLLAGRQRVPFYMYSDFLDVSYAYSWITPPGGVYNVVFDTFDGLAGVYSWQMGEFDSNIHVIYGRNQNEQSLFGETIKPDFQNLAGAALTVTKDWLTLRAGYFQADINMPFSDIETLAAGWEQAGFSNISNNVLVEDDRASFVELGFQADFEQFIVIGEYTKLTVDNTVFPDEESYYVMGGYRYNDFLFHATYGKDDDVAEDFVTGNVPIGVDPGLDFLAAATVGLTDSQEHDSTYYTLGLRWNFHDSASFKFEFTDYTDNINDTDANLIRTAIVTVF